MFQNHNAILRVRINKLKISPSKLFVW